MPRSKLREAFVSIRIAIATAAVATLLMVGPSVRADDQSLAQRRAYVESLTAAQKEALRRNQQRFEQLDEGRRQQLSELQMAISTSPERDRLQSIMRLYHQWMRRLTAGERLELLALPAEQRVRAIKRIIERQERDQFQELVQKSLSVEDREIIIDWLMELALRQLPEDEQQRLRAIEPLMRRRMEIMANVRRRPDGMNDSRFLERLNPTAADRETLTKRLSQSAQNMITAAKDDPEKRRLVQGWINAAIFSRRGDRPSVTLSTLDEFFESMDPAEKDYFNNLPPDRKRDELEQLYLRSRVRRPGAPRPGELRPGAPRPGDPRPPFGPGSRRRGPERPS